ncbi:MAG: outer membrane beta-barrel protein [Bacteroidia bacterium]
MKFRSPFFKNLICLALILGGSFAFSQATFIAGKVIDKISQPLVGATIRVLNKDSVFIKGAATNEKGFFKIEDLNPGFFIIKISYLGFEDLFLNKQLMDKPLFLGPILLIEKSADMKEVIVKGEIKMAEQKGDTTQYNAGAFKTNPDATAEDLVTKLPGVTSEDGKLKSGGEDIKQVLVDGKPFFGEDPSAVLKNLPAEVIDKIQIFDQKSSQSQLTGFDDGNTSKTINIITKSQFKNGIFGKIFAGYGYEDKYKAGTSINFFKDKRRITILANTNNINEQNFSAEDLVGVMSSSSSGGVNRRPGGQSGSMPSGGGNRGGGRQSGGQGNDANNFLVDQKNGISTTQAFGINYANSWKKLDFTGSYFLNYTENNSISHLYRLFISNENQGVTYTEKSTSKTQNTNHRINLKLEWKLNTANSITIQPRASYQYNKGNSDMLGQNKLLNLSLSRVNNNYKTNLEGINLSAPIQYKHSFAKKGRSLSANITPGYNITTGNSQLNYYTTLYRDSLPADTINQTADLIKDGFTLAATVSYSEPINAKSQVLYTYATTFNKYDSKKNTYNLSDSNYPEALDSSLSNTFNTQYFSQSLGSSYRYQIDKWNFNGGIAFQLANLKNVQQFPTDSVLEKTFYSLLPNASFQYKFTLQKNLRVSYNSSNNAPSADQLQEVINNKNPLLLTTGNPDLKQDWQNNLSLRYTSIDTKKNTAFFALLGGTLTKNYMVNSTYISSSDTLIATGITLAQGSQISKPVNIDGYYNLRSFLNYSFPVNKLKSKINFNLGGSINRTPTLINERMNYSNSSNGSFGIAVTSNISTKWDFTLSTNSNYTTITNTLQTQLNSSFINQNTRFKIQAIPWKGLIFQTDLSHQYYTGLSSNYNQNFLLWNAAIGYKFLKNQAADLRLSVYDIMKQNNSIARNTTETYYEDVQTNVLQRYFMLTFSYNLKFFKETKTTATKPE